MENVIKYFESLEARLATLEARVAELEAREPEVVEKVVEVPVEKVVEVEKIVEKIVEVPAAEPEIEVELVFDEEEEAPAEPKVPESPAEPEKPEKTVAQVPEPKPAPAPEPAPNPNAVKYGTPVDDIRKAIAIGDRFLFVRELFGGNSELMQKTLDEINGCTSFDEAEALLTKFGWDTESQSYQLFLTPLHRRFA